MQTGRRACAHVPACARLARRADAQDGRGAACALAARAQEAVRTDRGQMTVELAVAFPALMIVAVIAVNALTFFADCAVFDRVAHEAVRVHATSPAYRQGSGQTVVLVAQEIRSVVDAPNVDVSVAVNPSGAGFEKYTATLSYSPTLFGAGMRSEVFGVQLPRLVHKSELVVDSYKPGVIV